MPTRPKRNLSAGTTGGAGGLGVQKDVGNERLRTGIVNTASLAPPNPNPPSGTPPSLYTSALSSTIEVGDAATQGADPGFARGTHEHAVPAPVAPANVTKAAASAGASLKVAREDHKHDVTTAVAGASAPGDAAAEGAASSLGRSDHKHSRESFGADPAQIDVGDAQAAGVAATISHSDHQHALLAPGVPTNSAPADVAAAGTSAKVSREDHLHGREAVVTGFPGFGADPAQIDVGDAQAGGASATASHSDHQHALLAPAAPTTSAFGDVASSGAAAKVSREDHLHGREADPVTAHVAAGDPHAGYQKESEKDVASGYAGLNASSRTTKGVDTTDDVIIDLATKGLVMKDAQGTPHYWRLSVSTLGVLTTTDLGTSKP